MSRRGRKPASPELAELVDKAVTDQILADNVEENAGQMEEWNMGTPLPPGIEVAYRPVNSAGEIQFKCRVYASNSRHNPNRCIYRGTLFQCKLARDIWTLTTEKYRRFKIGEKHPLKSRAPYFLLDEDFAQNALNNSVDVQGYYATLIDLFLREGWMVPFQSYDTGAMRTERREKSREKAYGKARPIKETLELLCVKLDSMSRAQAEMSLALEQLLDREPQPRGERAVPIPLAPLVSVPYDPPVVHSESRQCPIVIPDPTPTLLSPQQAGDLADAVTAEAGLEGM